MVGVVCGLNFVVCCLSHFKNSMLGQGPAICQCLTFFSLILVCQHSVQGSLNICALIAMYFSEECVIKQMGWLKALGGGV